MSRRWSDVIDLIPLTDSKNENGFHSEVEGVPKVDIFANKKDVFSSEFTQANAQGIKLEGAFEIHSIDYDGEELLKYDGKTFEVWRTFDRGEKIELVYKSRGDDHAG